MSGSTCVGLMSGLLVIFGTTIMADAATIRVRCVQRSTRSSISVDGSDLPAGRYQARVRSGGKVRTSPFLRTVGDEVGFDFDSNPNDIAEGATPIPSNFIQDGTVVGRILNRAGKTVVSAEVACRVR